MNRLFCIGILFILQTNSVAQSLPNFQYTVKEGLPATAVYECIQDKKGFIWSATEFGLSRFDGSSFTNFTIKDGLYVNDIWGLFEDSKERIWIRSFSPYLSYIKDEKITHLKIPEELDVPWVHHIEESKNRNLWFSTAEGIIRLDNNDSLQYFGPKNSPFHSRTLLFLENQNGKWFLSGEKIIVKKDSSFFEWDLPLENVNELIKVNPPLDGENWRIFNDKNILEWNVKSGAVITHSINKVLKLKGDIWIKRLLGTYRNTKRYWIQTNVGLFVLDSLLQLDTSFKHIRHNEYEYEFVFKDREENLWFTGRSSGLCYYPSNALKMKMVNYQFTDKHKSFKSLAFASNEKGKLWIGTENGVLYKDRKSDLKRLTGVWDGNTRELFYYPEKDLIILGTEATLMYMPAPDLARARFLEDSLPVVYPEKFQYHIDYPLSPKRGSIGTFAKNGQFNSKTGELLLAAGNGVYTLNFSGDTPILQKLDNRRAYAACKDGKENVWFGRTSGLGRITKDHKTTFPIGENPLFNVSILDLEIDTNGILWVASDGYGLFGYSQETESFFKIKEMESDIVKRISFDEKGRIWAATNKGVRMVHITSIHPFVYTFQSLLDQNGLVFNEVNEIDFDGGRIIAGTNRGLSIFDSSAFGFETLSPDVKISSAIADGKRRSVYEKGRFSYVENDLVIGYSGLLFQNHKSLIYTYRLKGLSTKWNTTKNQSVSFHNLKPNKYIFQVKTTDPTSSKESELAQWEFEIYPHWSQSNWFIGSIIVLIILAILLLLRWWLRVNRQKNSFLNKISSLQSQALQTQMNPHFIFNALNSIQYLIGAEKADEANEYLALFGRLIRLNLEISNEKWVSLQKELECLQFYVELEKMRFGSNLSIQIQQNEKVIPQKIHIPGLILQPFVEKLLSNGINPDKSLTTSIQISIDKHKKGLRITLLSYGLLNIEDLRESKRIQAIEKRLRLLYDKERDIPFVVVEECGTKIQLFIPSIKIPDSTLLF